MKAASECMNESGNFDDDRPMGATKSSRLRWPWSVSQNYRGPTYRAFHPKFKRHLQETKYENVDIATSQVNSKLMRLSRMFLKWFLLVRQRLKVLRFICAERNQINGSQSSQQQVFSERIHTKANVVVRQAHR